MRLVKLRYTSRARRHIDGIHSYLSERNPEAARHVAGRIRAIVELLCEFPLLGHEGLVSGTREMVVVGLPYVIVHRIAPSDDDTLEILGVYHTAQDRGSATPQAQP